MKPAALVLISVAALALVMGFLYFRSLGGVRQARAEDSTASFYALETRSLEGEPASLADYEGKIALVVNLASKCGLTPQYEGLEALYRELSPRGFVILGFPSNDFMGQEPGTPEEIRQFCSTTYGVTFPIFEKVKVKGDGKGEIYQLLTENLKEPDWNFTKYLVDGQGTVLYRFGPRTKPDDAGLREKIEELLTSS
jgi:glutathione peroxidase